MSAPTKIPIRYIRNSATGSIGRYGDGEQFFGYVGARFYPDTRTRRWYAILHKFDRDGNHVVTDFWTSFSPDEGEQMKSAELQLREMIKQLGQMKLGDITVALFETEIDGMTCGLVDESEHSEHEWVSLEPAGISFYPPWDGRYDT